MKKINVITLGCSKNTVDSEHLMARLAAAGYEVHFDSDRTDAKTVVINTGGCIGDAKQESVEMILRAAEAKKAGKIERLFVIGCLSERYADELRSEIPEVDEYFGARTWDGIVRTLGASEDPALATERRLSTPKHYAYLKISEGCNWKCGYCAIPLIRGPHVSVPMEVLEEEARKLAAQGVRERRAVRAALSDGGGGPRLRHVLRGVPALFASRGEEVCLPQRVERALGVSGVGVAYRLEAVEQRGAVSALRACE